MAQHKMGDAGVPDGTVNSSVHKMSQTSWRTLKMASYIRRMEEERIPKRF